MSSALISFPDGAIQCERGDFVLRRSEDDRWQVFRVEDIVLLTRLATLDFEPSMALIKEEHLRRSEPVEGMNSIHLLVRSFSEEFDSSREMIEAIQNDEITPGVHAACLDINEFSATHCLVYQLDAEPSG